MSANQLFLLLATILGGLGLFVYGMKLMTEHLEALAGSRLRTLLNRVTGTPLSGAGAGTVLGAIVHSGPATVIRVKKERLERVSERRSQPRPPSPPSGLLVDTGIFRTDELDGGTSTDAESLRKPAPPPDGLI